MNPLILMMKNKIRLSLYLAFILLIIFSCEREPMEVRLTAIELSSPGGFVEAGVTDTIELVIFPENATPGEYTWSTSDLSVASVDQSGAVTGIAPGEAVITATTKDHKLMATAKVHVIRWTGYPKMGVHARPVAVDSDGIIWCGGIELTVIHHNSEQVYPAIKNVSAIAASSGGDKWFGTYGMGIWKYDGTTWTNYTTDNSSLASNFTNTNSMIVDQKGNVWFGTSDRESGMGTGVTMFDGNHWHVFNSGNGLVHNNVLDIAEDSHGNKWFVTSKGISVFDNLNWASYTTENTGTGIIDYAFSVAIDKQNNKWFGSYGGAIRFDGSKWTVFDASNSGLKWNSINDIAVDKDNHIWFATEAGVSKFDGTSWVNYTSVKKLHHVYNLRSIAIGTEGDKWIGTSTGILRLED
jgi:ligand-binding sensor domain-containing protein